MTWILFGAVVWLAYRQYQLTRPLAKTHQLVQSSRANVTGELLDRNGAPVDTGAAQSSVPPWIWLVAGTLYVICPLDGDFIPVVGWIDDVVVAYLAYKKWQASKSQ